MRVTVGVGQLDVITVQLAVDHGVPCGLDRNDPCGLAVLPKVSKLIRSAEGYMDDQD